MNANGQAMNGHLHEEILTKYQTRRLAADELQAVDRHLSGCGICRRVLLARIGPVTLPVEVTTMAEPLHLSYEQISAYVDGVVAGADKDRVEAHTFLCASCSREIADIRRLELRLTAAAAEARTAVVPSLSFTERIARFFAVQGRRREFGLAVGAIVAGFFMLYQADKTTQEGSQGGGDAARLIHLGTSGHPGLNLGGFLLLTAGIGYIVYRLLRRK
jgi:anti-sigma factor RsiW